MPGRYDRLTVTEYLWNLVDFLDGQGLVVTEEELVRNTLASCGDVRRLKELVTGTVEG